MKNVIYIVAALIVLGMIHFSGLPASYNITHPIWRINGTVFGGLIGVFLTAGLFWLGDSKPVLVRKLVIALAVVFVIGIAGTLYYANAFIDAADFNRFAIQMWHKGTYLVFATFVPLVAFVLRHIVGRILSKI